MRFKTATILASMMLAASGASAFARPAVASTDANLRSEPGVGSPVLAVIAAGAPIDVGRCTGSWCRVSANGGEGFLARSTIAFGGAPGAGGPIAVAPAEGGPAGLTDEYAYDDNGPYTAGPRVPYEANGSGVNVNTYDTYGYTHNDWGWDFPTFNAGYQGNGYQGGAYRPRHGHRFGGNRPPEAAGPR